MPDWLGILILVVIAIIAPRRAMFAAFAMLAVYQFCRAIILDSQGVHDTHVVATMALCAFLAVWMYDSDWFSKWVTQIVTKAFNGLTFTLTNKKG